LPNHLDNFNEASKRLQVLGIHYRAAIENGIVQGKREEEF
jgi:hypothetical protein